MKIIDTHCHLIDEAFASDVEACIVRAQNAGVCKMMQACCDETEFPKILDLCAKHPGVLFPSIGIHPENLADDVNQQLDTLQKQLEAYLPKKLPIGEIGLDLHWDKTRLADQLKVLERQFDWALEYDLPVLLHIRDAMHEFLTFLRQYLLKYNKGKRLRGILHCFSGTLEEAQEAMQLADLLIGVGGTLTYKKSKVPAIVKAIGLEHLVLETDAPYLAPVPNRGKRNEPAFTVDTAKFLSELLELPLETITNVTTANAESYLAI